MTARSDMGKNSKDTFVHIDISKNKDPTFSSGEESGVLL
jgi:hypothetical protein